MKHSFKSAMILIGLLGIGGSLYAQQPPDVVQSDNYANTAMGTSALNSLMSGASSNTAAGYLALRDNTIGSFNSAYGVSALGFNTDGNGNTGIGAGALESSTSSFNTAIGLSALGSNTTGNYNTASGTQALFQNTMGVKNIADGASALWSNTTGNYNAASGYQALTSNTIGSYNTASGADALFYNATGNSNAALGLNALACNTTGSNNTAVGPSALSGGRFYQEGVPYPYCTAGYATGDANTASGAQALTNNTAGSNNTATGYQALYANTNGYDNTATGTDSLSSNTTGYLNTATGISALFSNTGGIRNTAVGHAALFSDTIGGGNIGLGDDAGYQITTGNDNIEIANYGTATDNGTIRIGMPGRQNATYIAGIENTKVTGAAVYVTSSGQLGVLASSERYKTDVAAIGANTDKLQRLRPVTFHLKSDPSGTRQYGLIAEEVNKVYPELVIRDDAGNIQGVRYDELAPLLLNEIQTQQTAMATLVALHEVDAVKLDTQAAKIASLEQRLSGIQAILVKLQSTEQLVAQR